MPTIWARTPTWIRRAGCCSIRRCEKSWILQNQELHLYAYRGHIKVLTEAIYQERRQRATKTASENVDLLERAGLK